MFVLFEEEGGFKAGTVLVDNDSSLQVESSRGKRVKLKRANVLLEFREPAPADLLTRAQIAAAEFDTDFLWSVCGDEEFAYS